MEGLKVKQAYTPGPWTVSIHDDNGEKVIQSGDDDGIVANLECDSYTKPSQEIEANARLIASAPELLEACKSLINGLNQIPNQLIHGKHETTYKLIAWAEGAIKRVEVQS